MLLSQTFKDAIILTQRLGMRYLWIDSICIIQDDHNDWNIEFSKMREGYANAYLVVAADAGVDGERGLFASRFGEEEALVPWTSNRNSSFHGQQSFLEQLTFSEVRLGNRPGSFEGDQLQIRISLAINHDFFCRSTSLYQRAGFVQNFEPLSRRGWALQERLLAKRVLHFGRYEIVFECRKHLLCERGRITKDVEHHKADEEPLKMMFGSTPYDRLAFNDLLEMWIELVATFISARLTYAADCLPAVSGVARAMSDCKLGQYFAGMWENTLPVSLLWYCSPSKTKGHKRTAYAAPTWSWASSNEVGEISLASPYEYHSVFNDNDVRFTPSVLSIVCDFETEDVYGKVRSGLITLKCFCFQGTLSIKRGWGLELRRATATEALLIADDHYYHEDEGEAIWKVEDLSDGESLTGALVVKKKGLESHDELHGLILKNSGLGDGKFKRIGVFSGSLGGRNVSGRDFVSYEWFEEMKEKTITIV